MKPFKDLPLFLQTEDTKRVYDSLTRKKGQLLLKWLFDKVLSLCLLILFLPVFLFFSVWIKLDSKGPVFYRQDRVTQYGRVFKIFKFRTMVVDADKIGSLVTVGQDNRITKVGRIVRKYRLDEIPQLINVLLGDMSFVGTRPEVPKYTACYSDEMNSTLLTLAGITSTASIEYKEEDTVLEKYVSQGGQVDTVYVEKILPKKMAYNRKDIEEFSFLNDIKIMWRTFIAVLK
ncbi:MULTISPECIES: sugar transferase [unclassified Granulicatella]|uniref:sugar transferase n=1 Tax=unclassified Granulicatella TaxID=2630493 RepID=UPI001883BDFC|nr:MULTISPECIES: sugar transferase [unclassified Granulicatella]MBF0780264.1 sugar transferase [Granulicatella sp. 19428wC4_WM01]